ncbi:MAG: dockerin type I repeat-containing protein, partial [Planctomycetota bacterium]
MRLNLNCFSAISSTTLAFAAGLATSASAAPFLPTQWTPGDAGSTTQAWDIFTDPAGSAPDALNINPNGTASGYDANPVPSSFITSSGNIYSFSGEVFPAADLPHFGSAGGAFTTVLVNFSTLGNVTNITTATLTDGTNTFRPTNAVLTDEGEANGTFGGLTQEFWVQFNVAGSADSYTFVAEASGSSLGLDTMRVDTFTSDEEVIEIAPDPFRLPGDANGDGSVNLADFLILRTNFNGGFGGFQNGDFNSDGSIDLADFLILRNNFGNQADAPPLNYFAVPEPATAGLALVLAGGLLTRRR